MLAQEPKSRSERPAAKAVRSGILEAVRQVILTQGVPHLTLEAVAAQAGISKGGLLYHFPTKDSLLHGLLFDHHCEIMENCRQYFQEDPLKDRPGRIHRAWIRTSRQEAECKEEIQMRDIAAIVTNPALSEPMQAFWSRWETILREDGLELDDSLLIQTALAGIKMAKTMGNMAPEGYALVLGRLEGIATPNKGTKAYDETCAWATCAQNAWKGN